MHPQKDAVQGICSEQDDWRFRFLLGCPRAAAHGWGKRALIRTEISRIPQSVPSHKGRNRGGSGSSCPLCGWGRVNFVAALACSYKIRRYLSGLDSGLWAGRRRIQAVRRFARRARRIWTACSASMSSPCSACANPVSIWAAKGGAAIALACLFGGRRGIYAPGSMPEAKRL